MVVLAKSYKHGQFCVAGKRVDNGRWIRPVSSGQGKALSREQVKCVNPYGAFPVKPMQKAFMNFSKHAPLIYQPENHVIDGSVWQQNYKMGYNMLDEYLDRPDSLWGSGDRVPYDDIVFGKVEIRQSLFLVRVKNLRLVPGERRASFEYRGYRYNLKVPDPGFDERCRQLVTPESVLCISLGEPFKVRDRYSCFKIVAAILQG